SDIFGTPFESAFIKLHLMGIFTGYPDQTFKPDRPITRAEFLAVTLRALNFEKYVNGFKGATKYPDTPVDHWATGYINTGTAFGIVKGYPDGTFRPDSNVTYAEAVTMLVRMLGYTQYITPVTPGGGTEDWFANFVKMAVALGDPSGYGMNVHPPELVLPDGILTGVTSFNASAPASRGDLAIMVYNSLFVYCLGPVEWQSQGPVPGAFYYPTNTTLAENLGFHEMETFVTNAPPYDVYAGASQIELFEGWTTVIDGEEVFVPVGEDPAAFAAANGLSYPADFKPVHRLYDIPADSIWVSGKPADLTTLIGKPVRVIYQGDKPYIGQEPFANPAKLWYVRILNHLVENYKVAANSVGGLYYPGKTVGEIFSDLKLRVYAADPAVASKTGSNLAIDPRAVIFLEDTQVENPNVMLVKDADITVIRGISETEFSKDYEGHLYSSIVVSSKVWAILAKVWPGHIIKDVMPSANSTATYDKWGRVKEFGTLSFSYTDDNTFNKRLPTPYPTSADTYTALVEDDAKFVLGGGDYTNWNWYAAVGGAYSALDWFYSTIYPVGTVYMAPVKNLDEENRFSVVRFEGNEVTQTGVLEDIYRTKDQWGNDWVTQIKVSGKVYDVLFPGRGEFPAIAASTTGTKEEPTAPVGQVGAVESGATFGTSTWVGGYWYWLDYEYVFNNLWDEREDWLGTNVLIVLNADGKVRLLTNANPVTTTAYLEYGMVTRVNMNQDSTGYHLSIDVMKGDGTVVNYPLTELADSSGVTSIFWKFSWYNDHNRGTKAIEDGSAAITDYTTLYAVWQKLQNLVRDVVKLSKVTTSLGDILKIEELATNPGALQAYNTEGIIDEIGPTFDGTIFSLENTSREQLYWTFTPSTAWKPNPIPYEQYETTWLAAKDIITVPWPASSSNPSIRQPGTVIYDATLPAPNVPTPDGNILIKKMADLQREQFVQVFFQPVEEPANPYMCDWMLVNGQYIPVVKFIVIRPMLGTELRIIDSGYEPTTEEYVPQEGFHVWMQFNEPLNTAKSWMLFYNVDDGQWFTADPGNYPYCGEFTFTQTGIYPNDTMVFTPCGLVPGHYIVFYNAVDADTGTEVLTGTWEFDLNFTLGAWDFSGTVTATGEVTETPSDMPVYLEWTDACGNPHEEVTYTDSTGSYAFTGIQFYNFHDVTIRLDYDGRYAPNTIIITPDDGYITEPVDPFGGSYSGKDFEIFVD
ncbi:MAG: S-layer homology domain-containing protein, partial [Caldiserica bacterium]|nr:S-layer homology domain-containing protein [Caldisericota bacterium]